MLNNIYNQKVTILNKLKRADGSGDVDVWYKHEVDNAAWYTDSARSAGGTSVFIGTYITVLIPFNEDYVPYKEWKNSEDKETKFTMSSGDYVVLGTVPEEITAQNVIQIMQNYGADVCTVRHLNETHNRFGARVQLKIEGV